VFDDIAAALRTVLGSRERMRALVALGPQMPVDILRFLARVVPIAAAALSGIREEALSIPDTALRDQALASADGKAYHVAGACILATFLDDRAARAYVDVVAPLETIYDYLDNLCDRHPGVTAQAYPVLHLAIADALDPSALPRDYYALGPGGEDGGYLYRLVTRTQRALARVPNATALRPYFAEAADLYAQMQTYKHLPAADREMACVRWYEDNLPRFRDLDWHEFACAAGSQFQVYGPLYAAFNGHADEIGATYAAYFPYLSALHVLFDSFIDQAEDRAYGELNFATVYASATARRERIRWMAAMARERFGMLRDPYRHRFVLEVMTLFYLSHAKISAQRLESEARAILRSNGA
jgi:tetraprenyl-beta-curcumene synthase